jgi:hypothetical protein
MPHRADHDTGRYALVEALEMFGKKVLPEIRDS